MLALRRRKGERVRVRFGGADVWVTVAEAGNGVVRLAFEAPREVEVMREELIPAEPPKDAAGSGG